MEARCSAHPGKACRARECAWCGAPADKVTGIYLARLYPGSTTCRGCGRRQVQCTCPRMAA